MGEEKVYWKVLVFRMYIYSYFELPSRVTLLSFTFPSFNSADSVVVR